MEDKEIIEAEIIEDTVISDDEAKAVFELEKKYLESYVKNRDKMELKEWLVTEMKQDLPERKEMEVEEMAGEIIETIKRNDESIESLRKSSKRGTPNEFWFRDKIAESMSAVETNSMGNYLQEIELSIAKANESLLNEITTKAGEISLNPNLDGFIAEQKLAHTFNINAALEGSKYRAEALTPEIYGKNSVDIVIKNEMGEIVNRYQAKFGKTAEETIKYIKNGNYNNQRLLVPAEQVDAVQKAFPNKSVSSYVGGSDKVVIKGEGFTKADVKGYQNDVQNGKIENVKHSWDEYSLKNLTKSIGIKACNSALLSAGITTGFMIIESKIKGKDIDKDEIIEMSLKTGADTGIKAALAGALKAGAEKGVISIIPKGTPVGAIAAIATTAVENVKIMGKMANGELSLKQGIDKMVEVTTAVAAGTIAAGYAAGTGAAICATAGALLGPVGAVAGAVVGGITAGTVAYMAGSAGGAAVGKVVNTVKDAAISTAKKAVETVKSVGSAIKSGVSSFCSGVASFFGWR